MVIELPSINDLIEPSEVTWHPLRFILDVLRQKGVFAPWVFLDESAELDEKKCRGLFEIWRRKGHTQMMRDVDLHPPPVAAQSMGGIFIYGGEESTIEAIDLFEPLVLGRGVRVRKRATIGKCTIVGGGAQIGTAHVVRSVLFQGVRVASKSVIADSILGPRCVVESGVAIRSRLGDRGPAGTMLIRDFRNPEMPIIDTGRKVIGIIAGSGCTFAANPPAGSVFYPGCTVYPEMVDLLPGIYTPEFLEWLHAQSVDQKLSQVQQFHHRS